MARRSARPRRKPTRSRARPRARSRHAGRIPRRLAPLLLLALLAGLGAVALERAGSLPEPVAGVVRTAEAALLAPLLAERGVGWPGAATPPVPPASENDRAAVAQALRLLEGVPVEPERRAGYDRGDWPHWSDADGDCLDARHEVPREESLERVRLAPDGCSVVEGLWRTSFTGETVTDPRALDVDHFIPLQEAHDSGGHAWSRERLVAFANDLADPRTLAAVLREANCAEGVPGPQDWLPPDPAVHCRYAADWVAVKARWALSMDERERAAVGTLLGACAGG